MWGGAVPAFVDSRKGYWEEAKAGDPRFVRRILLHQLGSASKFVGLRLDTEFVPLGEPPGPGVPPPRSNFTTLPYDAERYEVVLQI